MLNSSYPRVCGDYPVTASLVAIPFDTTPRVRGLLARLPYIPVRFRYNPACAGTTTQQSRRVGHSTIQPRVCGDYTSLPSHRPLECDTTPRVRGLLFFLLLALAVERYNPACAGTTRTASLPRPAPAIQPRVCGDYLVLSSTWSFSPDTTPRVRGLLHLTC